MKKTIITLLALAGVAGADTVTNVASSYTTLSGQDIGIGFVLTLNGFYMEADGGTLGQTFTFESVSLTCTNDGGTYDSTVKLGIFEFTSQGEVGKFVGLSDAQSHSTTSAITYNFADAITLTTDNKYQFFFVNQNTDASAFSTESANTDAYKEASALSRFDRFNAAAQVNHNKFLPADEGVYYNTNLTVSGNTQMAAVTFNAPTVPEPATATLSLLALAGLAARRRRK